MLRYLPLPPHPVVRKKDGGSIAPFLVPAAALIVLAPWVFGIPSVLSSILVAAQIVVTSYGVARSYYRGVRPVALIYFMFSLTWLGIGPAYQLSHGQMAWGDFTLLGDQTLVNMALLVNLLAPVAFLTGSEVGKRHRVGNIRSPATISRSVEPRFVWLYIAACVMLAPFAIQAAGGLGNMFETRSARSSAILSEGISVATSGGLRVALVSILPAALSVAAAVLASINARRDWEVGLFRRSSLLPLGASLGLLVVFCNPFSNTRFIAILAFGSVAIILLRPISLNAGRLFALIAFFATAIIYPLADVFRHGLDASTSIESGTQAFASNDFDGFQQIANSVLYVEDQGHSWGHYIASALFYFVPRSIWSDKATPASIDVASNRGYYFTNLSLPFPAEVYLEYGFLGIALIMMALGYFCARSDNAWQSGKFTRLAMLAPILSVAMLGFMRGPLGSLAPVYVTAILLVTLGIIKVGNPRSVPLTSA